MSLPPIYDLFRKHGHRFHTNARKWMDDCRKCGGNKLFVELDDDGEGFRCHCDDCGFSGADRLRPARTQTGSNGGPLPRDDVDAQRKALEEARKPASAAAEEPEPQSEQGPPDEPAAADGDGDKPKDEPKSEGDELGPELGPASEAPASDDYTHIWRSKEGDFPCTPTGEEHRDEKDGRVYAEVRNSYSESGLSTVPRDELFAKADGAAPEPKPKSEPADDESYSHVWRTKHFDFPCMPTGEEERANNDGRVIRVWVRMQDGVECCVQRDELFTKAEAAVDPKPIGEPSQSPLRIVRMDADPALIAEKVILKNRPDGPFSANDLEVFEQLKREQPAEFARLCRCYPALAAAVPLDAATVRAMLENAGKGEVVELFLGLVLAADLNPVEIDELLRLAAKKRGIGLRPLMGSLKEAQAEQAKQRAKAARAKRLAERTDPRPMVLQPEDSAPWNPVMDKINEVLGTSTAPEPPTRDIDGYLVRARKMVLPGLHLFSSANEPDDTAGALPAPEQWLLCRMGEIEVAEMIETHIDYVDENDKSVHLKTAFVKHYVRRDDDVLPRVVAIATLPIVLGDGTLLAPNGLDRKRGIIFKVPKELRDVLPRREGCDEEAVREAMRFLCDDWLCDVAADFTGKYIQIAYALTLIERALLPERPTFSVTAGKSGGGKTTLFKMLIMAVTGQQAAAAAWSSDENERRKALLSFLLAGVPYVLWDNIPRGTQISCPHIERSCTAAYYTDRLLGISETATVAAAAIYSFTGNNVVPAGDLAARDLHTRLAVDRPDPQNRDFRHPDPVGWSERNRAEILEKLYTVLLGNPMLKRGGDAAGHTRFRAWYRLVGSAVEHAARCVGHDLDFRKLFVAHEADDEEGTALGAALEVMARRWPAQAKFKGSHIAGLINREGATLEPDEFEQLKRDSTILREFLLSDVPANTTATPIAVSRKLNAHVDEPVQHGGQTLVLRSHTVHKTLVYFVERS